MMARRSLALAVALAAGTQAFVASSSGAAARRVRARAVRADEWIATPPHVGAAHITLWTLVKAIRVNTRDASLREGASRPGETHTRVGVCCPKAHPATRRLARGVSLSLSLE